MGRQPHFREVSWPAGPQPGICKERNWRLIVAEDTLLQDTEVSACQSDLCLNLRHCGDDQGLSDLRLLTWLLFHMAINVIARDFKLTRRAYMDFGVLAKGTGLWLRLLSLAGEKELRYHWINRTCWNSSHNWSAVMGGYQVFRKDRQGDKGVWIHIWAKAALIHGAPQWARQQTG